MEQSFFGKLKRIKIGDLLHIFKFLIALPIALIGKLFRHDLWVLCDNGNEASDNAFWLFKYIRENVPEQDVIFAVKKDSHDYDKVAALGKVVNYGSLKHWIYYLMASKNVSSQKSGKPNAAICYVLEVYGIWRNKRAFLQHGIITADLSFLYYPHTKMKLFVTSTKDEWKYVNDKYGYPDGYVQELGLCRFDQLHDFKVKERQVLLMPTWRMYIRNEISAASKELEREKFMETEYYQGWNAVLSDPRFKEILETYDLSVVFFPHREMKRFLDAFSVDDKRITIASWPDYDVQQLLKESAYLITDFSSVAMDFAYMKKPLLYYQFDNATFRSNHHGVGYLDFKTEGFGPMCETKDEVLDALEAACIREFENEDKYLARHEEYFDLYDTDNCKRNYEAIKAM